MMVGLTAWAAAGLVVAAGVTAPQSVADERAAAAFLREGQRDVARDAGRALSAVDARARDGVRTWIGRLPDDGDYRIDVVRLAAGATELPYVFVISMR